jgi:hypothetical protein
MDVVRQAAPLLVLIEKGACAMRATTAQCAIVAATILALSGCRSGTSSSGWNWGWGRKSAASNPSINTTPSGPQLPSAGASQPAYAPGSYGSPASPAVSSGYPDQTSTNPYQTTPYPGQPTGYNNSAPPAASTMPNATAPGSNYGTVPTAASPGYGAGASTAAPQNGPYNEAYGQPATGSAQAYPGTPGYQAPNTQGAYQATTGQPGDPGQAAQAYGTATANSRVDAAPPATSYGAAADAYRNTSPATGPLNNGPGDYQASDPNSAGAYRAADNRYSNDRYSTGAAQPEQTAADRYAAASEAAGDPGRNDAGVPGSSSSDRYQPGNTGYNPGQTGYSPPGVPPYQVPGQPYQVPGQPNVVSTPRREPYYRPGTTSDYTPSGNARAPTPPTDRYHAPGSGPGGATDPYAPPGGMPQGPAVPNGY